MLDVFNVGFYYLCVLVCDDFVNEIKVIFLVGYVIVDWFKVIDCIGFGKVFGGKDFCVDVGVIVFEM